MTLRRIGLPDTDSELEVLAQASGLSDALAGWKARCRRGPVGRPAGTPGVTWRASVSSRTSPTAR